MEGKKMAPPPHQHPARPHQPHPAHAAHAALPNHHPQPQALQSEGHYPDTSQYMQSQTQQMHHNPPGTVIHQPHTRPQQPQPIGPRSPLLENHQDLYGTRQPTELARQYAIREQQLINQQRMELQQRSMPMVNSSYSLQSPTQDPILTAPVPPGYNVSVHQAYLRRNAHQLGDHNQIYQNHSSLYQPASQMSKPYPPYTSRISQPDYVSNHSHTQQLRQQYTELQQMKLHQQIQYQNQAQLQQQQTFAQRQILHQHLHSRQQSQQNIAQYGTSPSTAQLNEVNNRLLKKQDINSHEEYMNQTGKMIQNNKQGVPISPSSKSSGDQTSSPSTKSPSGSDSRRSSSGTSQALRSPIAQRPLSAPVTKAGWLYKQGSDGLKVWRKRWFVLSEYCLFYYKGQEEDKLLGSVLLPSYQVSICSGEEKGLRKFSFKCEHANMRTYVLAAPDQNLMEQWVKVLTMAATMQDGSSTGKMQLNSNNGANNQTERRSKAPGNLTEQDDGAQEVTPGVQHMYENAPPKPRRSNEGYQSPSPERVDRYDPNYDILREPVYDSRDNSQMKNPKTHISVKTPVPNSTNEAIYDSKASASNYATQRNYSRSPEAVYNSHNLSLPLTNTNSNRLENNKSPMTLPTTSNRAINNENRANLNKSPAYFDGKTPNDVQKKGYYNDNQNIYVESGYQKMLRQQEINKRMMENQYNQDQGIVQGQQQGISRTNGTERQSFERRTPDTYGRSVIVPGYYSKGRSGDYEDVYRDSVNSGNAQNYAEQTYRRPMSPAAYDTNPQNQRYSTQSNDPNQLYQAPPVQLRQKKLPHNYTAPTLPHSSVPRPHSADFLEYESKNPSYDPNIPARSTNQVSRQPPRPKSSLDINSYDYNGDSYYYSEASYAEKMRQSAQYLRNRNMGSSMFNSRSLDPKSPEYIAERKLSMPLFRGNEGNYDSDLRIERESIYGVRDQNRNINGTVHSEVTGPNSNWTLRNKSLSQIMTQDDVYNRSNSAMSEGSTVSGFNRESTHLGSSGDQFMRSASARLPSTGSDQLSSRDGEKKVQQVGIREESMKRLLEWKQRMLQSPLTRKPTPATLSLARSLPPGPSQRQTLPKASARLHNQMQPSYNSYSSDDEASMSASITGVENSLSKRQPLSSGGTGSGGSRGAAIPVRAVSPRVRAPEQGGWAVSDSDSQWNIHNMSQNHNAEETWTTSRSPSRQSANQPIRAVSPRVRRASDVDDRPPSVPPSPPESPSGLFPLGPGLPDLSAGELLGRTHEELVLLLIQLRRRHAATASAIEQCCTQIHAVQSRINIEESIENRQESLQRLEQLRRHLTDLERHYTKSKPLVHLVDNMVKLGALYNKGPTSTLERLEQNQILREKLLLDQAHEQKRWAESSESLSGSQVAERVEQLRAMGRSVAGEAQALRGLRREREALMRALGAAPLQQDLSRVHAMLAINSKKLEQTVAGNARLEQELAVLRQKLQGQQPMGQGQGQGLEGTHVSEGGTDCRTAADATAMLEDELKRVQTLVGDLQKQRQELSVAVRQLTDKSQSLGLVSPNNTTMPSSSSEYLSDSSSQANKKRCNSSWVETDLDNEGAEHGSSSPTSNRAMAPLYIDTHSEQRAPSPDQSDDQGLSSAFANLSNVEKQEIKTVRIVKRESERRQRDRERSLQPGNSEWSNHQAASTLDQLLEEDPMNPYSSRSTSLPRGFASTQPQYSYNSNSYQPDNLSNSRQYSYQKETTSYSQKSHVNPPNTLSLTNVNNPFDNISTSSANINNKFVSSPSLNNNDYMSSYQDAMQNSKYGYQSTTAILPLPVSSNYSISKHSMSQSVPYLDGSTTDVSRTSYMNGPISPGLSKTASISSLTKANAELSPVFTSEAARQIIIEMAGEKNGVVKSNGSQHRRQVPKEKRRHYTAPHHLSAKNLDQANGDDFFYQEKWYRARDDVDMERVLRGSTNKSSHGPPPLAAPPDVVRSTLPAPHTDHYSEQTIDRLLAAPNKILIPERYIPEQAPELSPEEQQKRLEKVESIKKMLSSTTPSGDPSKSPDDNDKRQREHLLQLNQILAKQVMEMSKIVAGTGAEGLQQLPPPSTMNQKP